MEVQYEEPFWMTKGWHLLRIKKKKKKKFEKVCSTRRHLQCLQAGCFHVWCLVCSIMACLGEVPHGAPLIDHFCRLLCIFFFLYLSFYSSAFSLFINFPWTPHCSPLIYDLSLIASAKWPSIGDTLTACKRGVKKKRLWQIYLSELLWILTDVYVPLLFYADVSIM